MRMLLWPLVLAFLFAPGIAGQDHGIDNPTEKPRPVLSTSAVDHMSQLLGGISTAAISACSPGTLTIGTPVTGQLDSSDCLLTSPANQYADFWVFAGVKGQSVTVTYSSAALSPLLAVIEDYSTGTVLANGSGASPVVFSYVPPTTANYYVGLTSLKGTFASGAYTLLVSNSIGESACHVDANTLCLSGNRFQVQSSYRNSKASGQGSAVPLSASSGFFTFDNPDSIELVVKVLNACTFDPHIWFFGAGLTNQEATVTVTDTKTGAVRTYFNPLGTTFVTVTDTAAFSTCP